MPLVTLKQLLEAGVHFGHQTSRWNPKMKRYIFTARNGIHIIDLQQTVKLLDDASTWVKDVVGNGRMVLFIGTKKQAQESIELEARRSGMPFVNHRWMGGMLTNFNVMRRQIERLNSLRAIRNNGGFTGSKKTITGLEEEYQRLERFFGGMAEMKRLPGAVYVVDPRKEHIAVTEAQKLNIPIVAITDSNCDPDEIDHVIPGNDDAIRAVKLITSKIADAALEARQLISPEELTAAPEGHCQGGFEGDARRAGRHRGNLPASQPPTRRAGRAELRDRFRRAQRGLQGARARNRRPHRSSRTPLPTAGGRTVRDPRAQA